MCQANPKFRFSEPADWQPRVGFMMDGWRFVYIWRPFCPGGFRIGDALTFVDVPPREGLYCVNGNGALAKLATHFEPGYVWESGGFTFFRPTINASDETTKWSGLGNAVAFQGSHLTNHAAFSPECLTPCQNVQNVPLNLQLWGVRQFVMFNPFERFNYSDQDTVLFIMNSPGWIPQCIHERCVCDSCGIKGKCTEFGYCACERGWTGKRCDEPVSSCTNPTDPGCPHCPAGFSLKNVNGRYLCTDINDCSLGMATCNSLGYLNCTYNGAGYRCTNCTSGYYEDSFGDCTEQLCGNGVLDEGEECDSGHMCKLCRCVEGSEMTFPESVDCISRCLSMPGAECYGGHGCNLGTCTCLKQLGFAPISQGECGAVDPCERHTNCTNCQNNDCAWFGGGLCQTPVQFSVQRSCTLQEEGNEPEPTVAVPEEPVQPTEEGLSRETEIIVVVVSVVGGVLIVLLIVAIVLLARRKRAQYTQIGNNDAPNDGYRNVASYRPPVRKTNAGVPRPIPSIEWQPKETLFTEYNRFPLALSKTKLDFNLNLNQMRVGQTYVDTFVLSINQQSSYIDNNSSSVTFTMHPPLSPKFSVIYTPESGEVRKDKPVEVKVLLTSHMTTEVEIITGIELTQLQLHTFITQHLVSEISPLIDFDELLFDFQNIVGDGSYGTVFKGTYRGQEVAVKVLKVQEMPQEIFEEFEREIDLMNKLRHKNIVQFIGASKVPNKLAIVTEFIELGNVASLLTKGPIAYALKLKIALDAARAMSFLHSNGILHRDLKPENLLLNSMTMDMSGVTVKLADFGTSRAVSEKIIANKYTTGIGTPIYMAPEILEGENYGLKADIFSFGVLLWVLFTQKAPYDFLKFSWDVPEFVLSGKREKIPPECPTVYSELIESCWSPDPEERPTAAQLTKLLERTLAILLENGTQEVDLSKFKKQKAVNRSAPSKRVIIEEKQAPDNNNNLRKSGFVDLDEPSN